MFNHDNDTLCAPLVILKCLFPLAAVSVEYTVSFPVTVKSPETATSSDIVQSVLRRKIPALRLQSHSEMVDPHALSDGGKREVLSMTLLYDPEGQVIELA